MCVTFSLDDAHGEGLDLLVHRIIHVGRRPHRSVGPVPAPINECWQGGSVGTEGVLAVKECWQLGSVGSEGVSAVKECWQLRSVGSEGVLAVKECWQ